MRFYISVRLALTLIFGHAERVFCHELALLSVETRKDGMSWHVINPESGESRILQERKDDGVLRLIDATSKRAWVTTKVGVDEVSWNGSSASTVSTYPWPKTDAAFSTNTMIHYCPVNFLETS